MAITQVTSNVIEDNTIKPNKLSTGYPTWDTAGNLSAVAFVGDGTRLTGIAGAVSSQTIINAITGNKIPGTLSALGFIGDGSQLTFTRPSLSVVEVTDTVFEITPANNNTIFVFTASADCLVDLFPGVGSSFTDGHTNILIQGGAGNVILDSVNVYNVDSEKSTRKQYSVVEISYIKDIDQWILYGDTGTEVPLPPVVESTSVSFLSVFPAQNFAYAVSGNSVFATGLNNYKQLALGTAESNSRSYFTRIPTLTTTIGWKNILPGKGLALSNNNELWRNNDSYFATGTFTRISANLKQLFNEGGYFLLSTFPKSDINVFALSSDDSLVGIGTNIAGNMGLNLGTPVAGQRTDGNWMNNSKYINFTKIPNFKPSKVSVGGSLFTLAISGGELYTCGNNDHGQLGINECVPYYSESARSTFTKITGNFSKIVGGTNAGVYPAFALSGSPNNYTAFIISDAKTWTRITAAYDSAVTINNPVWSSLYQTYAHAIAISANGTAFTAGYNYQGELGRSVSGGTNFQFTSIPGKWDSGAAGHMFSFLLSGTDLYAAGNGPYQTQMWGYPELSSARSTFTKLPGRWNKIMANQNAAIALSGTDVYTIGGAYSNSTELGVGDGAGRITFTKIIGPANAKWTDIDATDNFFTAYSGTDVYMAGGLTNVYTYSGNQSYASTFTKVPWSKIKCVGSPEGISRVIALSGNSKVFVAGNAYATNFHGLNFNRLDTIFDARYNLSPQRTTFTSVYVSPSAFLPNNATWTDIACIQKANYLLSGTDLYGCGYDSYVGLSASDTPYGLGRDRSTFTKIPGFNNVVDIEAGWCTSFVLSGTSPGPYDLYAAGAYCNHLLGLVTGPTSAANIQNSCRSTFTKIPGKWNKIVAAGKVYNLRPSFTIQTEETYNYWDPITPNNIGGPKFFLHDPIGIFALSGTDLYGLGLVYSNLSGTGQSGYNLLNYTTFTKISGAFRDIVANGVVNYEDRGTTVLAYALSTNGKWLSYGYNGFSYSYENFGNLYGQLALGNTLPVTTFTQVTGATL